MGGAREGFGAIKLILYGRAELRTLLPPLRGPPPSRREAMGGARESMGAIE